jgi:DNA-binding CsgD family transcriptional regulator
MSDASVAAVASEETAGLVRLSARQRQVLDLIADGYTESEIAAVIGIAPRTVRMHADALRMKLGVGRRRQLPRVYRGLRERGLVRE